MRRKIEIKYVPISDLYFAMRELDNKYKKLLITKEHYEKEKDLLHLKANKMTNIVTL